MSSSSGQTAVTSSPFSRVLNWGFRRYVKRFIRKNFNAIRVANVQAMSNLEEGPVVCYVNHPGWWDPMVMVLMNDTFFPERRLAVPVDAAALKQYPILNRLGFFAVDRESTSGLKRFLHDAQTVLADGNAVLWITPAGRFEDVREKPAFMPGLGHLVHNGFAGSVLPMAIEYTFWNERFPEMLIEFGEPLPAEELQGGKSRTTAHLEHRLAETQRSLAEKVIARNPSAFETLSVGKAGVGGAYGWFQQATAIVTGRKHRLRHDTANLDYSNPKEPQPGKAA